MPVLDHETHQATIGSERYDACREKVRGHGYYSMSGLYVVDHSSTDCRYDKSLTDPKCEGCHRRGGGEAYDQQIRSQGK